MKQTLEAATRLMSSSSWEDSGSTTVQKETDSQS
jgi:hypothetical protein